MAIVTKTINGYGPYQYRVTYENGKHHWEYIGPVGGEDSSSTADVDQEDESNTNDEGLAIEDVGTYSDGSPQVLIDELADELGIDPGEITSIKSVSGEGKDEFDWVSGESVTNGQYEVYVDSELAERVKVEKDGTDAKLTTHDSRRSLTEGLPRTSWRTSGFDTDYSEMVGKEVEMELESGETVSKELVLHDDSESSESSIGLKESGYTALVDDGSIQWTSDGPVYAKQGIMFDSEKTPVESITVKE
ncbi:hypothetical protein [Haloarcula sp. CGMCC 1.6347]|uniref:hypothetical protein n=1 Tax=Haloarcula sp. CGMCC 1.6347 TaxID=3111455 RepID=UPI00300F310C